MTVAYRKKNMHTGESIVRVGKAKRKSEKEIGEEEYNFCQLVLKVIEIRTWGTPKL